MHFGSMIYESRWPTFREVVGFVLMMGFSALLAAVVTEQMAIHSDLWRSATAAILVQVVRELLPWIRLRAKAMVVAAGLASEPRP